MRPEILTHSDASTRPPIGSGLRYTLATRRAVAFFLPYSSRSPDRCERQTWAGRFPFLAQTSWSLPMREVRVPQRYAQDTTVLPSNFISASVNSWPQTLLRSSAAPAEAAASTPPAGEA